MEKTKKNAQFYEEEVFEVLDTETYDKIIMVGDWNVFLNPEMDQKNKYQGVHKKQTEITHTQ